MLENLVAFLRDSVYSVFTEIVVTDHIVDDSKNGVLVYDSGFESGYLEIWPIHERFFIRWHSTYEEMDNRALQFMVPDTNAIVSMIRVFAVAANMELHYSAQHDVYAKLDSLTQ